MTNQVPQEIQTIADAVGGTIDADSVMHLPDGSGCLTMSMPLPAGHWLTQDGDNEPPMPMRTGLDDPRRKPMETAIRAAARYAIRASTMNGKIDDFDPDAMERNFIVGLLGYYTDDGCTHVDDTSTGIAG